MCWHIWIVIIAPIITCIAQLQFSLQRLEHSFSLNCWKYRKFKYLKTVAHSEFYNTGHFLQDWLGDRHSCCLHRNVNCFLIGQFIENLVWSISFALAQHEKAAVALVCHGGILEAQPVVAVYYRCTVQPFSHFQICICFSVLVSQLSVSKFSDFSLLQSRCDWGRTVWHQSGRCKLSQQKNQTAVSWWPGEHNNYALLSNSSYNIATAQRPVEAVLVSCQINKIC